jgi:hypothetical protein
MGSEATRDLAQTSDFEEIVIADADFTEHKDWRRNSVVGGCARFRQRGLVQLNGMARGAGRRRQLYPYHFGLIATARRDSVCGKPIRPGLYNIRVKAKLTKSTAFRAGVTICLLQCATPAGQPDGIADAGADQLDRATKCTLLKPVLFNQPSAGLLDTRLMSSVPAAAAFLGRKGSSFEVPAFSGAKQVLCDPVGGPTPHVPHT